MGMLMHQTWLNEQKKAAQKPVAEPAKTEEPKEPDTAKKTVGRRKMTK